MRCEYLCQPLGVDTPAPYLSWAVSPACGGNADARVLVSYEEDFSSLLWDSGWTARQCAVTYAGEPLRSGSRVWWKVLIRPAGQEVSTRMRRSSVSSRKKLKMMGKPAFGLPPSRSMLSGKVPRPVTICLTE